MFLTKSDLRIGITESELNAIVGNDDTIIATICSVAIAEMRTYLYDNYNVDNIFNTTGSNRHQMLLNLGVDIAIYLIVARCQVGVDNGDKKARYDRAISILKQLQKSTLYSDLPRRENTTQTHINVSSNPKRSNYF